MAMGQPKILTATKENMRWLRGTLKELRAELGKDNFAWHVQKLYVTLRLCK